MMEQFRSVTTGSFSLLLALYFLGSTIPDVCAQPPENLALRYAAYITVDELREDLTILASDPLEGRDTGKEGQKMAAAYIRDRFVSYGIPPITGPYSEQIRDGYFQDFELLTERSGSIRLISGERELRLMQDLLYFNETIEEDRSFRQLIYMGDGSDLSKAKGLKGEMAWITEDGASNTIMFLASLRGRATAAAEMGAEVLLVSTPRMPALLEQFGHFVSGERMRLAIDGPAKKSRDMQVILVDEDALDEVLGRGVRNKVIRKKPGRKVPVDLTLKYDRSRGTVVSENVLAYIEGSDLKDELVVITAHYDHIGVEDGEVYNGADDNGSGTVAIMAMAKAFAKAKADGNGPRRSILVMPVSGEERGLLGSRYYSERPVFPLESTVANLNIDMIGRVDSVNAAGEPYVYIIGSDRLSSDLHAINEQANELVGLHLDYTFNAADDPNRFYFRSDHYNFARKGVPAIFYFSGVHEDYHGPGDTVDKIMFDLLHQRALLTFHTAWLLTNRDERIKVDGKVE
jgi:hypothetical protein